MKMFIWSARQSVSLYWRRFGKWVIWRVVMSGGRHSVMDGELYICDLWDKKLAFFFFFSKEMCEFTRHMDGWVSLQWKKFTVISKETVENSWDILGHKYQHHSDNLANKTNICNKSEFDYTDCRQVSLWSIVLSTSAFRKRARLFGICI